MSLAQAEFDRLMAAVRQGSEDALKELFVRLNPLVCNTIRKHLPVQMRNAFDSADFAQVAWGTLFRHRTRLYRCESARDMEAFIATVTYNKLRLEIRKRMTQKKHNVKGEVRLNHVKQPFSSEPSPSQVAMAREKWQQIIQRQPPHYQEIIRLVTLGHRSREIAEKLGMEAGSVRRIRRKIIEGLDDGSQAE